MKEVTVTLDDYLYEFYRKVGEGAGVSPATVMADALFKLAGALSAAVTGEKEPQKQ